MVEPVETIDAGAQGDVVSTSSTTEGWVVSAGSTTDEGIAREDPR